MRSLKLQRVGTSLGVTIPKDILERLGAGEGHELFLSEMPDGALKITAHNPNFELQMKALRVGMFKYNKALKALSK